MNAVLFTVVQVFRVGDGLFQIQLNILAVVFFVADIENFFFRHGYLVGISSANFSIFKTKKGPFRKGDRPVALTLKHGSTLSRGFT
jgi:hypothetical protein